MGEPKEDFENELDGANEYPLVSGDSSAVEQP
jgi:hypothetical protein